MARDLIVFDAVGRPCRVLSRFAAEAQRQVAPRSMRVYLAHLMRFADWLRECENMQLGELTDATRDRLRQLTETYLYEVLDCRLRVARDGRQIVRTRTMTNGAASTALAALHLFFQFATQSGWLEVGNPLVLTGV